MANLSPAEYEFASKLTYDQLPAKLRCAVCNKAVLDAMKTDCCDTTMCKKCATSMTGSCPICEFTITEEIVHEDKRTRTTLKAHVKGELQKRNNAVAAAKRQREMEAAAAAAADSGAGAPSGQETENMESLGEAPVASGVTETMKTFGAEVEARAGHEGAKASTHVQEHGGVTSEDGAKATRHDQIDGESENIATPGLEETTGSHDTIEGEELEDDDASDIDIITERPGFEQQNSFAKAQDHQATQHHDQPEEQAGVEDGPHSNQNMNSQQQGFNMDFSSMNGFNPMLAMQAGMMPPFNIMPNMMGMPNMGMDPSMMFNMASMMNGGMMNGNMMGGNFGAMPGMGNMNDSNSYNQYGNRFDNQGYGQQPYFNDNRNYRGRGGRFSRGRGQNFNRGRGGWNQNQRYQNYQNYDQMPQQPDMTDSRQNQANEQWSNNDVRDVQQQQPEDDQYDRGDEVERDGHNQVTHEDEHVTGKGEEQDNNSNAYPEQDVNTQQDYDNAENSRQGYNDWQDEPAAPKPVVAPPINAPSGPKAMRDGLPNSGRYSRQPVQNYAASAQGRDSRPSSSNGMSSVKIPTGPASMKVPTGPAADIKIPKGPAAGRREQDGHDRSREQESVYEQSVREQDNDYDRGTRGYDDDYDDRKERSRRSSRSRSPSKSHREKRRRSRSPKRRTDSGSDSHRHDRDRDDRKEKRRTRDYDDRDRERKRPRSESPEHESSSRRHRRRDEKERSSRRDRSREKHHRSSARDEESSRKTKSSHRSSRRERDGDEKDDEYAAPVFDQKHSRSSRSLAVLEEPQDDIGFKIKGSKASNQDMLSRTAVDPYAEERERMKKQRTQRDAERRHGKRERSDYEVDGAGDDNSSRRKKRSKPRAKYEDEIHHGDHENERERSRWTDR